ncbi:MAG TPA: redoxin family protein [Ktedonobacterales bacterium]|nr:redoxin family protein [Ktedonobacterales bacterium]
MPDQINYRRHGLVNASSVSFAAADVGLFATPGLFSGTRLDDEGSMPALNGATAWLNSQPLTIDQLRGKVVAIDFWTYTCINWLRTLPYLRAWAERYHAHGLVVIGVHTPEFPFEHDTENVRRAVQEMRVMYPVAIDNDYAIWDAFNNHYWPALYLVDAQGRIRYHQFGEGDFDEAEEVIQRLLAEAGNDPVGHSLASVDAHGLEVGADWAHLASRETYVGSERAEHFASPGGVVLDEPHVYTAPERLSRNEWALVGDWTVAPGFAALNAPSGRLVYRFHARDLHLVMGPATRRASVRYRVSLDGRAPGVARGSDVDELGAGIVSEQRLHQLIRQPQPIVDRLFTIEFLDAGIEAYAFTFG